MISYDEWKNDFPEEEKNECEFCGTSCAQNFCSTECERAHIADNTDRSDE